nr:sulfatase-like hydrolase/transferase [Verrucomicrobiota bacterium]
LQGYSGEILADDAIRWLGEGRDKAKPFFLYLCFHEPHEPIATEKRFTDLYPFPDDPSRAAHHGNITQLDDAFGRLLRALDAQRLSEQTLVFFTSDNGPALTPMHPHGSAGTLRAKKAHLYEGGIRVPGLVRWPGRIKPGAVSDEPVSGVDILPTLCAIAGLAAPGDRSIDGANLLPLLEGKPVPRARPLYWQYQRALSAPKVAMRIGDWKILARLNTPNPPSPPSITEEGQRVFKTAELAGFELYNLREDIGESRDLAAQEPERLKAMAAALKKLHQEARDESPVWPAWQFTNYDAPRIQWPPYWKPAPQRKK